MTRRIVPAYEIEFCVNCKWCISGSYICGRNVDGCDGTHIPDDCPLDKVEEEE